MSGDLGFDVDIPALRGYASNLNEYESQMRRFGELIVQAKVPGPAWGVVGFFTKDGYQESCGKLREFVSQAEWFLSLLDDSFKAAANTYQSIDEATRDKLDDLKPGAHAIAAKSAAGREVLHESKLEAPGPAGGFVKFGTATLEMLKGESHGTVATVGEAGEVVVEGLEFATECLLAIGEVASNPLKFLVEMGLDFLLDVFYPLEYLLHLVTGDPEALEHCAEGFERIGEGLNHMSLDFVQVTNTQLAGWAGDASMAARGRLAEFSDGVDGLAARSFSIAELLEMSAIVMEIIEDLIKSLISELVMWALTCWIPALAAAVPTCGASTAAAAGATVVQTGQCVAEATSWIDKLIHVLEGINKILLKLAFSLAKAGFKAIHAAGKAAHAPGREMSDEQLGKAFRAPEAGFRFKQEQDVQEFERAAERERARVAKQ